MSFAVSCQRPPLGIIAWMSTNQQQSIPGTKPWRKQEATDKLGWEEDKPDHLFKISGGEKIIPHIYLCI